MILLLNYLSSLDLLHESPNIVKSRYCLDTFAEKGREIILQ